MDLISAGRKWSSDKAHSEVAYCLPLMTTYAAGLQKQGIDGDQDAALRAHDDGLVILDKALAEAEMRLEKLTDQLAMQLDTAVTTAGTAYTFAVKAFQRTSADTLESFPPRSNMSASVDRAVRVLNDCAAFVTTYRAELTRAGAPLELEAQLAGESQALLETNKRQEAAKQAVNDAAMAIYQSRGEIYALCGLVYLAGRTAYRKDADVKAKFRYEHMSVSASPSAQGSSTVSDTSDEAAAPAP